MRDYCVISFAYWVFTLTDGALRMLVLMHLHEQGFTPIALAGLFLLYELAGVVTNFTAGWVGARFGLKSTLWSGLSLQIAAVMVLAWQEQHLTVLLVMLMQGLSGVAKDLTKMSAKSYVRLLVPQDGGSDRLLRLVAVLTGSKNTLKGVGFFLGGWMLGALGFAGAMEAMAMALGVALLVSLLFLPSAAGRRSTVPRWRDLWAGGADMQALAMARLFLFGSRDAWFAIALPVFFATQLDWAHAEIGAFLAAWVIGYGIVQAAAPRLFRLGSGVEGKRLARLVAWLALPLLALIVALFTIEGTTGLTWALIAALFAFGLLFAGNSALHSYLVLAISEREDVALRVGFYYMANAAGRLFGTLLSGTAFQLAGGGVNGLVACICVSLVFIATSCIKSRQIGAASA